MGEITINAYTLRFLALCERRVWLDQHGGARPPDVVLPRGAAGLSHEDAISAAMFGPTELVPVRNWAESVQVTRDLMHRGVDGIRYAAFEAPLPDWPGVMVRGRVDWLRRAAGSSDLGRWFYEPVEIKLRREVTEEDRLQLDLYLWLLRQAQGVEASGWLWTGQDGDGGPHQATEHQYREDRLLAALDHAMRVIGAGDAPPVFLASHCEGCRWNTACRTKAQDERQITLLPGLSRQAWAALTQAGVSRLDEVLNRSVDELRKVKGIGPAKAADFHAYSRAFLDNAPVVRGKMPKEVYQPGVMLDLETNINGDPGLPWCFGYQVPGEAYRVVIVSQHFTGQALTFSDGLRIDLVTTSDEGWQRVAQASDAVGGPVYHWGSFEMGVLRKTAPRDVRDALQDRLHDLNRTFRNTVALPVEGTSIKTVGPYLGYTWPPGSSAFTAWEDYRTWLKYADRDALARACRYNRADVEALAVIWQWMVETTG